MAQPNENKKKEKREFNISILGAGSQYGLSKSLRGAILAKHIKKLTITIGENLNIIQMVTGIIPGTMDSFDFVPAEDAEYKDEEAVQWYFAYNKKRQELFKEKEEAEKKEKADAHEARQPQDIDFGVKFFKLYTEVNKTTPEEEENLGDGIIDEDTYRAAIASLTTAKRAKFLSTGKDRKKFKTILYNLYKAEKEEEENEESDDSGNGSRLS